MLSQFFIERPRFAFVISIVITLAGLIAIMKLPVSQYPNITPSQVQVSTNYPGADASTILNTVVAPLEQQINGVKKMMYISSTSADDGSANITVTFPAGTDGDINTVNVQNRANQAEASLPSAVKMQGLTIQERSTNMLLIINLFSPKGTHDSIFLSNYINLNLNDEISRVFGVGNTTIFGPALYAMRIWINPDRLANLKMTVNDVVTQLQAQNVQVSAGALGDNPTSPNQIFRYTIQTQGRLSSVKEFENIILRTEANGAMVRLKDVARIELGAQTYQVDSTNDGMNCALLAIYQLPEGNGLQIAKECQEKMQELSKSFPDDVKYAIQFDTTEFVRASITEVVKTLFEAVLLVILVTFLFLQDWRSTLIPTLAIPVSLIGTFAVLLVLGYSINLITLFALILAIGIVVDDAIVVVENVHRIMEEEKLSPKEAAKKSMMQVTSPIVATTLVLLAMFIPVCFLPGITGELYRQFGVTITVSVLISALNALTLSPALCATMLRPLDADAGRAVHPAVRAIAGFFRLPFRCFNWGFDKLTHGYSVTVSALVKRVLLVLAAYAVLLGFSYHIFGMLPTGFIPDEDQGSIFVNIQLPDAAAAPRTTKVIKQVADIMQKTPGVAHVMSINGYSILSSTSGTNTAFLIGVLDPWDKRKTPELQESAIMSKWAQEFAGIPDAIIVPFGRPTIPGLGQTGGFSFVLEDTTGIFPQRLESAMDSVIMEAKNRPEIASVFSPFRANVPQVYLKFDRDKAMKMGVPISEITNALQGLLGYTYVNDFNKFGKVFKVEIQADQQYRNTIDDIRNIYVRNSKGDMVPLDTMVEVETQFGSSYINRYNLYTSVTLNGNAASGYSSGQAMKAMEEVADQVLPAGMKYDWTDLSYQEKLAGGQTGIVFALALLFIYLFLVAQYESWMIPLSVMLSVPVAFFGALVFLLALGQENNIYTQVGFVLLFGLASKTAILIVEFAKERHAEGASIVDAAIFAAKLRFRAVLMTAISFVLGVFPLVVATGAGAASRRSLGTVVFGGMLIACIFGTILIPSFYVIIAKMIDWTKRKKPQSSQIS